MNNPNPVVHKPSEREESKVTDPFITEIFGNYTVSTIIIMHKL